MNKKRTLAIKPHRRYTANQKRLNLNTVRQAQTQPWEVVGRILARLMLPPPTYYRWQEREREKRLEQTVAISQRRVPPPNPRIGKLCVAVLWRIRCWVTSG